ncbi:MAG: hypothetical protein ACKOI2_09830, partial [Actinomycetota bacterium]
VTAAISHGRCGTWMIEGFGTALEDAQLKRLYEEEPPSEINYWMFSRRIRERKQRVPGWPWRTVKEMAAALNGRCEADQAALIQQMLRDHPSTVPDNQLIEAIHAAILKLREEKYPG